MSLEITQFYEKQFATNWEQKLQQKESRLASTVESTSFEGRSKWFNQLDVGSMQEITTRKGDTPDGDSTGDKYWIFRRKFEFVRVWDEDDAMQLGAISLPTSDEMVSFTNAENRTKDDVIISAMDATRYIGENGTTPDTFDAAYSIAVDYVTTGSAANSGLTVGKILHAKKLMDTAEVDDGDRFFAVSAQQLQDMLLRTEIVHADYVNVKALVEGKVDMFAGFKFVRTERLSRNTSTDVRTCFAWHKSGIKFASIGRDVHMDVLPGKRHCKQLRGVSRMGAVRTQNGPIIRIYTDESP